jgi:hypothetical protein
MKHRTWLVLGILLLSLLVAPSWHALADDGGEDAILGGSFVLKSGERRSTDLTVIGGKVELQEQSLVEGNVIIVGGEAAIDGEVRGDVVALGGQVSLGKAAVINGDLVIFGTVRRHADAQVKGNVVEGMHLGGIGEYLARIRPGHPESPAVRPPVAPLGRSRGVGNTAESLITLLVILGIAAVVIRLLPTHVGRVSAAMNDHALLSLGIGSLTIIVVLILLPILIILCLGIPFAIVLAIAFVLCGVLGWVTAGKMVGHRILGALRSSRASPLGETLLGTLVITALSMVPCIGLLLALGIVCWGMGGAVLTRLGTSDYPPDAPWITRPAAPSQPPVPPATGPADEAAPSARHPGRDTHPLSEAEIWGQ